MDRNIERDSAQVLYRLLTLLLTMKLSSAAALAVLGAFSSRVHAHNDPIPPAEENPQECVEGELRRRKVR